MIPVEMGPSLTGGDMRSAHGGSDRGAAGGDAGVRVRLRPIRLAHVLLLGAATTEEHRGDEEER
ncbi:MAG TPA: hypothetical protein VII54_12295 [Gaiellaceae bacterium]